MKSLYLFLESNVFNRNIAFDYKEIAKALQNKEWCEFAQSFIQQWDEYVVNNPINTLSGVNYKDFLEGLLTFVKNKLGDYSTLAKDIKIEIENQDLENKEESNLSDDILRIRAEFNIY